MGQLKKGNIYNIDKYYTYNISNNGNIESNDWGKLQYEIIDIKRTNVKNYYILHTVDNLLSICSYTFLWQIILAKKPLLYIHSREI